MQFFVGIHQVADAQNVGDCFISVHRLRRRKSGFVVGCWIMDSGAFSTIFTYGGYPEGPEVYVREINYWKKQGTLRAAVTQDYMCEPAMLEITGMTVADHQRLTVERYDQLVGLTDVYIMPVLQGYQPSEYVEHIRQYGDRLKKDAWVGVGSVCKRNGKPDAVLAVFEAIHMERPDLQLHAFGLKETSLKDTRVRKHLRSADSMSWSLAARRLGRNANSWSEAVAFQERIINLKCRTCHYPVVECCC